MSDYKELCESLKTKLQNAYTEGTSIEDAEKLAAEFLWAQMQITAELAVKDLDARMRKSGIKGVRASMYLNIVQTNEKKPTEAGIAALIDTNKLIQDQQDALDTEEVSRDELERYYNIFQNAHIYFRGVAKGNFNG